MTGCRRVFAPDARASADYEDSYRRWWTLAGEFERMAHEGM
jgi:hypothetical protein